ncbi:hypothetical protein [Streptomyces sp. NPDC093094]|uniref:hypothetical protein n=1 Tax=Streptomyces sp. NPDC093094 TaxID=3366026 RepID=UPI003827F90C
MADSTTTETGEVLTFAGTEDSFSTHYGISVTTVGLDVEGLLALGHLTDRHVLAVTTAHSRRAYGHCVQPDQELQDLLRFGTRRVWVVFARGVEDLYAWRYEESKASAEHAQPATLIDTEHLTYEDKAVQSECPACGRPSRSTAGADGRGRSGWGAHHHCRTCHHAWPAVPFTPVRLERDRRWPVAHDGGCFACPCLPGYPCTSGCTIGTDPVIGQLLCTRCRAQHSPATWQQLAAVAYGTARRHDTRDAQRDRWLYSEALRGIPPTQAARTWTHRVQLTAARRVLA